jgi:hypothetical protein
MVSDGFEKQRHLYPRLVIMEYQNRALVFQVASKGALKNAQALGICKTSLQALGLN